MTNLTALVAPRLVTVVALADEFSRSAVVDGDATLEGPSKELFTVHGMYSFVGRLTVNK